MNSDHQYGTAYLVETREHENLDLVLASVDECLPENWSIKVFCSSGNEKHVELALKELSRCSRIELLETPLIDQAAYSKLLLNDEFWQGFDTENLLCFQMDSLFNPKQSALLKIICQFDYVGAPWSESIQRRWSYIPSLGGNGGVCFSKRSARLQALAQAKTPRVVCFEGHSEQALNEDIWFSNAFIELGMNLPSCGQAQQLLVESCYSQAPFAAHKPWRYLAYDDYQSLLKEMPNLELLRVGCNEERKYLNLKKSDQRNGYRSFLHRFARACLSSDNYYEMDLALQVCQSRFPDDAIAHNLHAMLAFNLGLYEHALKHVNKAIELNPSLQKANDNKRVILKVSDRVKNQVPVTDVKKAEVRYLLIHAWGSGMGFDLMHLLQQLLLAEMTDRTPVVYWGKSSVYNATPHEDCFTRFFEPISNVCFDQLEPLHASVYPEYWQSRPLNDFLRRTRWRNKINKQLYRITPLYYLARAEPLLVAGEFTNITTMLPWLNANSDYKGLSVTDVYRRLMTKFIKPKPSLQAKADDFVKQCFNSAPFIAIHLRGTDKHREKQASNLLEINNSLIEKLSALDEKFPIFVMTDDSRQIKFMQKRFGRRVFSVDVTRSENNELGVHLTATDNQTQLAQEVLIDVLIAQQSSHFFGCGLSYLACVVAYRRKAQEQTTLLPFDVMTRYSDIPEPGTYGIQ